MAVGGWPLSAAVDFFEAQSKGKRPAASRGSSKGSCCTAGPYTPEVSLSACCYVVNVM